MIRYIVIALALAFFVSTMFVMLLSLLFLVAFTCALAIPVYVIGRYCWRRSVSRVGSARPMQRIRDQYVDGSIDLFEFERRVARHIAVER